MQVIRTEEEIDKVMNECADHKDDGTTKFPGMTYEDGIMAAIEWLRGDEEYGPMA